MSDQIPDQTSEQTPEQTHDENIAHSPAHSPADPSGSAHAVVTDLDTAPQGTALFSADTANLPEETGEGGVVTTAHEGDTRWQLVVVSNRPRIIWQRTWHITDGRWRTWKKFEDSRNTARATAAAISAALAEHDSGVTSLVSERIAAEAAAREAAMDDLRAGLPAPGMDRDAVTALIDTRIDAELDDERAARTDAITTATAAVAAGRQAVIDASIASAITIERVAADGRMDDKIASVTARLDSVTDDLTAEATARSAADTATEATLAQQVTAERDARTAALAAQRRATTAEITGGITAAITGAKQEAASALRTALLAERGARDQAIATAKSEVSRDTATHVAGLLRGMEGRIGPQIAAAGFPRGTRMLFQQSTAPAGWTKDGTINDKALRVVGGSVGSGGSKGFSATFGRPRVSGSVSSTVTGRTAEHVLTWGQMPRHNHSIRTSTRSGRWRYNQTVLSGVEAEGTAEPWYHTVTTNDGNNKPHSHGAGSLRVSSAFTGHALDLRLAYVDVIVAVKD